MSVWSGLSCSISCSIPPSPPPPPGLRDAVHYSAPNEEDMIAATVMIAIDLVVNVLLICGANKDYSGRRKDLRWEGMGRVDR